MSSRRLVVLLAATVVVLASCSSPSPKASNSIPPPAEPVDAPVVWAALGGDETQSVDQAGIHWTTRVLATLPAATQLVDVAATGASVGDVLDRQLPALLVNGRPATAVTIWVGRNETDTSIADFTSRLRQVVDTVRAQGATTVVLVTRSDTPPERGGRYTAAIQDVAAASGAAVADVVGLARGPRDPDAQATIATVVGPLLTHP